MYGKPVTSRTWILVAGALSILAIAVSCSMARPLIQHVASPRDVAAEGPQGELNLIQRWRDTVGTATLVYERGPVKKNSIFHALRSGPMSDVYRETLASGSSLPCEPRQNGKCEVAIDGFATVGEVQYNFSAEQANIRGRSTQVMVACRCLSKECGEAILIRPVNILKRDPVSGQNHTCLYERVGAKFSDCHGELLRASYREDSHRPNYSSGSGKDFFYYSVKDPVFHDSWIATGQRGWSRDCLLSDIDELPVVDVSTLTENNVSFNIHTTDPAPPHCKAPEKVQYYRDRDDSDGAACAALYEYAVAAASHRASQQDEIAIGHLESSYIYHKPEQVSNTELALSCSAAALGLLFVWSTFRKQGKKLNTTILYTIWIITVQVLSYVLEGLPLHTALGSEIAARDWASTFAFVDGTLALASDQSGTQGSAKGSVLILTSVVGEVRYKTTRVSLIAGLTAFFDLAAFILIALTIIGKVRVRTLQSRGMLPSSWSSEVMPSKDLTSLELRGFSFTRRTKKRGKRSKMLAFARRGSWEGGGSSRGGSNGAKSGYKSPFRKLMPAPTLGASQGETTLSTISAHQDGEDTPGTSCMTGLTTNASFLDDDFVGEAGGVDNVLSQATAAQGRGGKSEGDNEASGPESVERRKRNMALAQSKGDNEVDGDHGVGKGESDSGGVANGQQVGTDNQLQDGREGDERCQRESDQDEGISGQA